MDRCRDYLGFTVQFLGIGYVVLWPLSTPGHGLFGASVVCRGAFELLCGLPHPLHFGIGLHAFGALCALLAIVNFGVGLVRRLRSRSSAASGQPAAAAAPAADLPSAPKRMRRPPLRPRKLARARTHFGLRGLSH